MTNKLKINKESSNQEYERIDSISFDDLDYILLDEKPVHPKFEKFENFVDYTYKVFKKMDKIRHAAIMLPYSQQDKNVPETESKKLQVISESESEDDNNNLSSIIARLQNNEEDKF